MESDINWPRKSLEATMPKKFRKGGGGGHSEGNGFTLAMCALCLASISMSGILTYREFRLEARIASLEERCNVPYQSPPAMQQRLQPFSQHRQESHDVLIQRLRREIEEQSRKTNAIFRIKRQEPEECNCPAGEIPFDFERI